MSEQRKPTEKRRRWTAKARMESVDKTGVTTGGIKMRYLDSIPLSANQRLAVKEADRILKGQFPVVQSIVFGSVARGEATEESDLDLLILASQEISPHERAEITKSVFAINQKYGTLISTVVVDHESWHHGIMSASQLKREIERDGVFV